LSLYSVSGISRSLRTCSLRGLFASAVVPSLSEFPLVEDEVPPFFFCSSLGFFFLVPVPKRLSRRLSNRDFLALVDFSDRFSFVSLIPFSWGSAACVSVC
jgi:hypothetical protein